MVKHIHGHYRKPENLTDQAAHCHQRSNYKGSDTQFVQESQISLFEVTASLISHLQSFFQDSNPKGHPRFTLFETHKSVYICQTVQDKGKVSRVSLETINNYLNLFLFFFNFPDHLHDKVIEDKFYQILRWRKSSVRVNVCHFGDLLQNFLLLTKIVNRTNVLYRCCFGFCQR